MRPSSPRTLSLRLGGAERAVELLPLRHHVSACPCPARPLRGPSATVRMMTPKFSGLMLAMRRLSRSRSCLAHNFLADADGIRKRHQHEVAARHRNVGAHAGTFGRNRLLDDLNHHLLAFLEHALHLAHFFERRLKRESFRGPAVAARPLVNRPHPLSQASCIARRGRRSAETRLFRSRCP